MSQRYIHTGVVAAVSLRSAARIDPMRRTSVAMAMRSLGWGGVRA